MVSDQTESAVEIVVDAEQHSVPPVESEGGSEGNNGPWEEDKEEEEEEKARDKETETNTITNSNDNFHDRVVCLIRGKQAESITMWHVNNASEMQQHDEEQSKLRQQPRILGIKRDSNYEANLKERLLWREMQRAEREGNNRFFLGISDSSELRHTPASVEGNKQARGESGVMSGRLEEEGSMSVGHELKDMSGGIEEEEKVPQFHQEGIYQ